MSFRKLFLLGLLLGMVATALAGKKAYHLFNKIEAHFSLPSPLDFLPSLKLHKIVARFDQSIEIISGKPFGPEGWLTAELFRGGKVMVDVKEKHAIQHSASYRDSAWIRSTKPLPKRYKISVVIGGIDYGLEKIQGLPPDPQYSEGPRNENGVYLLAITDVEPRGHHTNLWWHQHRKVTVDVDNNVWGHGTPNPVFMVYFDKNNELNSWDGKKWTKDWVKAVTYDTKAWYRVEIEKTWTRFILSVYSEKGKRLSRAVIPFKKVLNEDSWHKDYFVLGDPHENYYVGVMKIKEIQMEY